MENLKLLSDIALSFQKKDSFKEDVESLLGKVGNFIGLSRIAIFLNKEGDAISKTFEWHRNSLALKIKGLETIIYKDKGVVQNIIEKKGYLSLEDITDMPEYIDYKSRLSQVKSLLLYPLIIDNELGGFIEFDEFRRKRIWTEKELQIFNTLSAIISNAYEKN